MQKIPRLSVITLGVSDLERSTDFYRKVFAVQPNTAYAGVTFFELPGTWVALFPLRDLAKDISPLLKAKRPAFSGVSLAHNARAQKDVGAIMRRAKKAGARIVKPAQHTYWGGFAGYFVDPDGFHWEIAWGPMFTFKRDGTLAFKKMPAASELKIDSNRK